MKMMENTSVISLGTFTDKFRRNDLGVLPELPSMVYDIPLKSSYSLIKGALNLS